MSLNGSQCGGCSTEYDTLTSIQVVCKRFSASAPRALIIAQKRAGDFGLTVSYELVVHRRELAVFPSLCGFDKTARLLSTEK